MRSEDPPSLHFKWAAAPLTLSTWSRIAVVAGTGHIHEGSSLLESGRLIVILSVVLKVLKRSGANWPPAGA